MQTGIPSRLLMVVVVAAASLSAQGRVWIVDANNGQGAHFTSVQAGHDAAKDGDTILVRPGAFGQTILWKSVVVAVLGAKGSATPARHRASPCVVLPSGPSTTAWPSRTARGPSSSRTASSTGAVR